MLCLLMIPINFAAVSTTMGTRYFGQIHIVLAVLLYSRKPNSKIENCAFRSMVKSQNQKIKSTVYRPTILFLVFYNRPFEDQMYICISKTCFNLWQKIL